MNTAHRPEGLREPGSGPVDRDPLTRKRLPLWDRGKFLLLLAVLFGVLVLNTVGAFREIITVPEAIAVTARESTWLLWLAGLEAVRQVHFLISERSAAYHRFWTEKVFGGWNRWTRRRFGDWTRYRLARAVKWAIWISVVAVVLGRLGDVSPLEALIQAPAQAIGYLPTVLQVLLYMLLAVGQFAAIFWFLSRGGVDVYFPDDIKTRFSDVWGQDHVVERVKENIVFLERPDEIEARGGYVPSGILLWGPPGTGKTLMAEAVAGSTGKPYVFVDPGAFINMFFGVGVLKVKSLFRKLRKLALRYGGVIVFFDEADSLGNRGALAQGGPGGGWGRIAPAPFQHTGCNGFAYLDQETRWLLGRDALGGGRERAEADAPRSRTGAFVSRLVYGAGMGGGGGMGTLQALLTEISGLKKPRGFVNRYVRRLLGMRPKPPPKYRILIMMATNLPEALDEALLRPGRIDRIYKVGYPSKDGRIRTYQGYFGKVRHELTDEQIGKLATITPYATGATIKDLVNESLITAIRDGRDTITWSDVMRAKRLKQLGPPEDVEYIERERHAVAVHEACHAVVAYRTRHHLEIDLATIEKGADYLGMVSSIKPEDQFTRWKSEYEADIMVSLASLAGERMFFGEDNSSGVSSDLQSATLLTGLMEAHWGMGIGVASLPALQDLGIREGRAQKAPGQGGGIGFTATPRSRGNDLTPDMLPERIEFNLNQLLEKTAALLRENRREVLSVAHALEHHKTLNGDDVVAVIEGTRGPLVDGTVYGSDGFYEEIEAYHVAAAEAHRGHSAVQVDLPAPDRVPELEPSAVLAAARPYAPVPSNPDMSGMSGVPSFAPPWGDQSYEPQETSPGVPAVVIPAMPPTMQPTTIPAAMPVSAPVNGHGTGYGDIPDFPYQNGSGPAVHPAGQGRGGAHGLLWALIGGVIALVVLTLLGVAFLQDGVAVATEEGADGVPSGTALILFLTLLGVVGLIVAAVAVVRAQQAARRRAEEARDRAAERAQLLAAAMDPEIAMRVLGYDGRRGPEATA
ncbi:AAA family ATPase [Microtetraspora malaysiensis]|uniref:AAA family ATPase n=1 Tax=Microtetraspora malaysiensis TaxID=161358 RepID=UPI00082AA06D|nr:AAA family ATPase [Microtetraspora malaysiensis]